MNFTREPIIETIITPRDGFKLLLRANRGEKEFNVDAVEVVNFGNALFFRSTERPKSFLVPVAEYEVVETRETRVVLKNASVDKSVKIAGGKDPKEEKEEKEDSSKDPKKRERRRTRRRRPSAEEAPECEQPTKVFTGLIPPPTNLISDTIRKEEPDLFKDQLGEGETKKAPTEEAKQETDLTPEKEKGQPDLPMEDHSDKAIPVIAPPPMPTEES